MDSIKTRDLFSDKDIERLEKIKQLIEEIKEIDSSFSLSNIINVDEDSILVVSTNQNYCKHHIDFIEEDLKNRIGIRCVLIPEGTKIEKTINIRTNHEQEKDYETTNFYDERGNVIKEESTYYK
mgnify:CR=1 FL=1